MAQSDQSIKGISQDEKRELMKTLENRFHKHMQRHEGLLWDDVEARLSSNPDKLPSILEMEKTGGEPDVVGSVQESGELIFFDCSEETPKHRRNLCYDRNALEARKNFKPEKSVEDLVNSMGIELLTQEQYKELQKYGEFDRKTSSWLKTPADIRKAGGAIFGDRRYGNVFIYHNGASSYYAGRGFRGLIRL